MAKISANGAVKLAEAHLDTYDDEDIGVGGMWRTIYVLRSDGVVLRATQFPQHPNGAYDRKRSAYKVQGRFTKAIGHDALLAAFERFAARKGATVTADRGQVFPVGHASFGQWR